MNEAVAGRRQAMIKTEGAMKVHLGRIGMAFAAVLAVAIEITVMVSAPRCSADSPKGPTLGHSFLIAGCR